MKKSQFINLVLLSVSFAASAKSMMNKENTSLFTINGELASYSVTQADNPGNGYVSRGGFGDQQHKGAEQSHSENQIN